MDAFSSRRKVYVSKINTVFDPKIFVFSVVNIGIKKIANFLFAVGFRSKYRVFSEVE